MTEGKLGWQGSLRLQLDSLSFAAEKVLSDPTQLDTVVRFVEGIRGIHFFTGVGKNGFVAEKVASTFNSLGIRSIFLDPVHTLHGDMGVFTPDDVLYLISKSGETTELFPLLDALSVLGFSNLVAVTSVENSSLSRRCKVKLVVPVKHEGDHLGLAPVASSLVYMAVLQSIAVHLSEKRGFTAKDFVRFHPGGTLGKTRVSTKS